MKLATSLLLVCVAALLALGMVMLSSAGMSGRSGNLLLMQLLAAVIGITLCIAFASLDYRHFKTIALPLYVFTLVLLLLVLIPGIGMKINGARRWLDLKVMQFQPSELAKFSVLIALAAYCAHFQRRMGEFKRGLLIPGGIAAAALVLILAGRDYGTTMLLGSVCAILLLLGGVRWRFVLPILVTVAVVLGTMIWHNPVRRARVIAWLNPEAHAETVGYQAEQAKIALGAGGWTGQGLGNGRQKLGFVPEHHTDFILSVIGEEFGFVATGGVLLGFMLFVGCGVFIAWHARDTFGMLLAAGMTFLIGLQAFINIGVVTSVLPNKGLPLPFISYGGSNLMMMLACVGVLLSVARHSSAQHFASASDLIPVPRPA